jgi:serine/threonine protein kinase
VDELKNELALVAKLKHKNLVRLVGVCLEQQERLLVYEFVPNRSLDLILFGAHEQLGWEQRYRIINGIARGLQYFHEDSQLKVVHRDLKASNILLDANMNPRFPTLASPGSSAGTRRRPSREPSSEPSKYTVWTLFRFSFDFFFLQKFGYNYSFR